MSYTVKISISGLWLWVPYTARKRMVLLAPEEGAGHAHRARLYYHSVATRRGGEKAELAYTDLEEHELEIGAGLGSPTLSYPQDIIDLDPYTRSKVDSSFLDPGGNSSKLDARVALLSGHSSDSISLGHWYFPNEQTSGVPMANLVEWTIEVPDDRPLPGVLRPFGSTANNFPTVYPVEQELSLWVLYVPRTHMPEEIPDLKIPDLKAPAGHFRALYSLFQDPEARPLPLFHEVNPTVPPDEWVHDPKFAPKTVGCMGAGGQVG